MLLQKDDLKEVLIEVLQNFFGSNLEQNQPSAGTKYYTRDEACAHLHITYTTLWRMEKHGNLRVHKIGRRSLYAKEDVDALISNGTSTNDTTEKLNH